MTEKALYTVRRTAWMMMVGTLCVASARVVAGQGPAPAQSVGTKIKTPVYDVATIKPNNSMSGSMGIDSNADMYSATNVSLKLLLENAYGIKQNLISGLPGWAESAHYDIVAKVVDADLTTMRNLTREQRRGMLQQLLADRFQLQSHIETKTLPVFELVTASGGPLFKESPVPTDGSKPHEGTSIQNQDMTAQGISMASLGYSLSEVVERTVIDKTGLKGKYDLRLKWRREDDPSKEVRDDSAPSIFAAVQEQLGLKLQPAKGPVETLVIDRIAMPSEN